MKINMIILGFIFLISGVNSQNIQFKHEWSITYTENYLKFISLKKVPYPYSSFNVPQAMMYIKKSKLDKIAKNDLAEIVADEICRIKNELSIEKYLEIDHKPKDNIVTYFDNIENVQVAIIKYRFNSGKVGQMFMPSSIKEVLFIHKDMLWISSLIVLYEADQNNIRRDQMTILQNLISK